ncbi:MAG: SMC-Scp complex subunit ScpB [Calditrichia bacterium]
MKEEKSNPANISERIPEALQPFIGVVEALIFSSDSAISADRISEVVNQLNRTMIGEMVRLLNEKYRAGGHAFRIREIAGGYQMFTLPEFSGYIDQLFQDKQKSRLTQKALETLAIIAYKQPVTRHDMEEIRGVNVDGVLKTLLNRHLINIAGRADAPGSPFLYRTTRKFLDYFGLNSLEDLPKLKEIEELIDVEDESHPGFESLFKEVAPKSFGMRNPENGAAEAGEDENGDEG